MHGLRRGLGRFIRWRRRLLRRGLMMAVVAVAAMGFFPARWALVLRRRLLILRGLLIVLLRRRLLAQGLDAAQGPAQILDFAFIGEFLALGEFDEFEDFLKLI